MIEYSNLTPDVKCALSNCPAGTLIDLVVAEANLSYGDYGDCPGKIFARDMWTPQGRSVKDCNACTHRPHQSVSCWILWMLENITKDIK
jgi:hypothetical protein